LVTFGWEAGTAPPRSHGPTPWGPTRRPPPPHPPAPKKWRTRIISSTYENKINNDMTTCWMFWFNPTSYVPYIAVYWLRCNCLKCSMYVYLYLYIYIYIWVYLAKSTSSPCVFKFSWKGVSCVLRSSHVDIAFTMIVRVFVGFLWVLFGVVG